MGACLSRNNKSNDNNNMREILLYKGEFLGADLRAMFNNPVYSDIIITCKDGGVVYGSKLLLAARSDVFARLILNNEENNNRNNNRESRNTFSSNDNHITFTEFSSSTLLIILEFLYMGDIMIESLTLNNIVEAYLGAEYFLLTGLEEVIITFLDNALKCSADNNLAAKLLTQASEFMLPSSDDLFFRTLHNSLVVTPLETIEYHNLTAEGLSFILSPTNMDTTYEEFVTPEYGVFRYIVLWAAHHCNNNNLVVSYFEPLLPPSDHAEHLDANEIEQLRKSHEKNKKKSKSKEIKDMIMALLNPLLPFVDFKLIHPSVLANIIEPLDIIVPNDMLNEAFKYQAQLPAGSGPGRNRGTIAAKPENLRFQWSQQAHGKQCVLLENDVALKSNTRKYEWARASLPIRGHEIYEWDIYIEESCKHLWIGVCTERRDKVNYSSYLGGTNYGWVLGSNGLLYHNNQLNQSYSKGYGVKFGKGDRVTVHLNMGSRSLAYSINGIRHGEAWNTLPAELYPAVSLKKPAKVRIEMHKKPIIIDNSKYMMPQLAHTSNLSNLSNMSNMSNMSHSSNYSHSVNLPHSANLPHSIHSPHSPHLPHLPHSPHSPHAPHAPHAPLTSHTSHSPHRPHRPNSPHSPHPNIRINTSIISPIISPINTPINTPRPTSQVTAE
ncbi:hypothetical protein RhiirA4_406601 [Rhizophagus irregularis]|uniref:Uncharacterized protein n=1 Tax=Rhizophagus irregularis TaxID=588596 RepID=A0A2I1GV75_9GLOM|nr:hypothetical protein RhiirA4_406601 [Rhizophagus irregularis]